MRLLFAIKSLNVAGGGAERVLVQVANGLVGKGHDIAIMTFDTAGSSFYPLDERIKRIDLGVGPPGHPTPRAALLKSLPNIRKEIGSWNPDLTIGFMHSIYVPLAAALLGTGRRLVASEHIGEDHFKGRAFERILAHLARRRSVALTVPSRTVREEFGGSFGKKLVTLPNPIDIEALGKARGLCEPVNPPVILSVGRFMAQKNQAELIKAFSQMKDEVPGAILRIVGDGVLRPQLTALVEELGLGDRVQLPGTVKDMPLEYARCTLVVVPSRYESFGLVTAEALAAARPVVGFADCVGTNELIESGVNGWLLDGSGDRVSTLAKGMSILLKDDSLRARLAEAGPKSVVVYSLPSVVDAWDRFAKEHVG